MATAKEGIDAGVWFIGKDFELRFTVYTDSTKATCLDVSGYAMKYVLRKGNDDQDPPLIEKTTAALGGITVTGTFDANPDDNTQLVVVAIDAADTDAESAIAGRAGAYQHALARTDAGNQTILLYTDEDTPVHLTKAAI